MSGKGSKRKHAGWLQVSYPMPSKEINELSIPDMADRVKSSDNLNWLSATAEFCRLLSREDPPIKQILESRVVHAFILFLTEENNPDLQAAAAKALKYIATGTSDVTKVTIDEGVNIARDALRHLIHSNNDEVLRHATCCLAVLSGCEHVKVRELIRESDLYERLVELIRHPTLVAAALRTLGNIVEGDEHMISYIVRDNVLVYLHSCLLRHDSVDVCKESCWIISYVTGNGRWLQEVIDADLIGPLVCWVKKGNIFVKEAAVRAISNAASGATHEQIRVLVSKGCIEALCYQFCCRNSEIFKVCLEGLEAICAAGVAEDGNPYAKCIERIEGWDILWEIVGAYEEVLFKKALAFLKKYGPMSPSRVDSYLYDNEEYDEEYDAGAGSGSGADADADADADAGAGSAGAAAGAGAVLNDSSKLMTTVLKGISKTSHDDDDDDDADDAGERLRAEIRDARIRQSRRFSDYRERAK